MSARRVAVLVDVDRERRAGLQLGPGRVAGGQGLLAVLDAELAQLRQRLERLVERPVLVHVHLERNVGDAAHRADALDVLAVTGAELELEALEAAFDALGAAGHVVRVAEPHGPGGRRARPREAEQAPDGNPEQLPAEVVQGTVDRGLRRVLPGPLREPGVDLLQRKGIVAEQLACAFEEGECGLRALLVALDRCGLAVADVTVVLELDVDDVGLVFRVARDRERLGEPEGHDASAELHGESLVGTATRGPRA